MKDHADSPDSIHDSTAPRIETRELNDGTQAQHHLIPGCQASSPRN